MWQDLQNHMQQPHFIQAAAQLAEVTTQELEVNVVDMLN